MEFEGLLAFLGAVQGLTAGRRMIRDVGLNERTRSFTELVHVHEFLACFIDTTYAIAKHESPAISPTDLCYRVYGGSGRFVVYERVGDGPFGGRGFLRMEDNVVSGEARYEEVEWPKYIVAVRGTIISRRDDRIADLRIVVEVACGHQSFYQPLLDVLSLLQRNSDKVGGVWVTGHSLGAFIALTATLRLAEDTGIVLPTHLFHLPCVSPDVLFTKFVIGGANALGTMCGIIPVVGRPLKHLVRKVGAVVTRGVDEIACDAVISVSPSSIATVRRRRRTLDDVGYMVHVYSNPRDSISNEFIERSRRSAVKPISTTALLLNAVSRDSPGDACHLVAPMIVHSNERAEGLFEAHKISQWYRYDPVNHTSKRVVVSL